MAFSLASLFGKSKAGKSSKRDSLAFDDADSSDFADEGSGTGKGGKKKPGLLSRLMPGRKRKEPAADPFDNPELMALVASEVASLPPQDVPRPPASPAVRAARKPEPAERDEGPDFLDATAPAAAASSSYSFASGRPNFEMPPDAPKGFDREGLPGGGFAVGDDGLPGLDDEFAAEIQAERRRRILRIAAGIAGVGLLAGGGAGAWWFLQDDGKPLPVAGKSATPLPMAPSAGSGNKVTMALPPPAPAATRSLGGPPGAAGAPGASGDLGSEKSASRRPWLNDGGVAVAPPGGTPAGGTPPAGSLPPAATSSSGPPPDAGAAPPSPPASSGTSQTVPPPAAPSASPAMGTPPSAATPGTVAGGTPASTPATPAQAATTSVPAAPGGGTPTTPAPGQSPAAAQPVAAQPTAVQTAALPVLRPAATLPPLTEAAQPRAPGDKPPGMPTFAALPPPPPADKVHGLGPAPIPDLSQKSAQGGVLPVIAADGRAPWTAYARPYDGPPKTPRVAVVVVGLGMDAQATDAAITRLPPVVTLSFSPYAPDLAGQMQRARQFGHEVTLDLPMDAGSGTRDPGPLGIRADLPPGDALARLAALMGRGVGYVGLVGVGSDGMVAAAGEGAMSAVLGDLGQRGLLYLDSAGDGSPLVGRGAPAARAVVRLDERPFREAVDNRLAYLAEAAKARGMAVGVVRPLPVSFERLSQWAAQAAQSGTVLAPLSATVPPGGV